MADWQEVSLAATNAADIDKIEEALLSTGALSVTIKGSDDEIILIEPEPGQQVLWDEAVMTGLYANDADLSQVTAQLHFLLGDVELNTNKLENRVWELEWTKHFKPMCFGKRLWVCPSNQSIPESAQANGDAVITLDPGLAFGTGTHPTTAMVLTYLAENSCQNTDEGQFVIDYGSGSGILGIAALKMGAKHALLTDIDPMAITTSLDNANINQVVENISACLPDAVDAELAKLAAINPSKQADLLIANILLTPLLQLKNTFVELLKPNSPIILTGLLNEQVDEILATYQTDFTHFQVIHQDAWAMVLANKR